MTAILRVAVPSDVPALFSIRTSVRENHLDLLELAARGVTPESVAAALAGSRSRTWVVQERDRIHGFATADAASGSVFALFISPAAEGHGYGRVLLTACEEWLFAQGWETIWLTTADDLANRAHRFYRAAGWVLVGPADHGDVRYEKRAR